MRALLVRVGADTKSGGWHGLVDSETLSFAYIPIPEDETVRLGDERPYSLFAEAVSQFGSTIPRHLRSRNAHLDPDFEQLTYGDGRRRADQIRSLAPSDLLVFYAGLRDVRPPKGLVYALIGLYVIDEIDGAAEILPERRHENAHTRRGPITATDVVVRARPGVSGRLTRCIPFAGPRGKGLHYRVRTDVLDAWGGLIGPNDGWVQRSARLPEICDPQRFQAWLKSQAPSLVAQNN